MITSIDNRKTYLLDIGEYPHFIHVFLLAIGNPPNPDNWEEIIVKKPLTISVQPDDQNSSRLWRMSSLCCHEIYSYQKMTGRSLAQGGGYQYKSKRADENVAGHWMHEHELIFFTSSKWSESQFYL